MIKQTEIKYQRINCKDQRKFTLSLSDLLGCERILNCRLHIIDFLPLKYIQIL